MIRRMLNFLYGSTPATFESAATLEESVRRLGAVTDQAALTSGRAVGRVREDKVVLQRSVPFVRNSFKPFFIGRFERTRSGVRLHGRFAMHWSIRAFLTYWFGFAVVWIAFAAYAVVVSDSSEQWWFPLAGLAMFGAGLAIVSAGKYLARNDIIWLSNVIGAALSAEVRPNNSSKPMPLRGTA